ncbi:hypothetical protein E3V93_02355 [Microbacterium sp. 3H14]|nr:hypothetical protein E3V93_02355 [Microbacterium sp. 3H14]
MAHRHSAGRPESQRRRFRLRAMVVVVALLTVIVAAVVGPTQPAVAADRVFLIDSLSHQGDDLSPGDGVCLTSTGVCTLRAALQESNASAVDDTIVIAPAEDVDASTPGVQPSGTIVVSGSGAANWMHVGALSPFGDGGAAFLATRSVVIDFQSRLGVASLNDGNGVAAFYLNGPGVTVRNFENVRSNETAFVFGPSGDDVTVENGSCVDSGSIALERCFWFAGGSDRVTLRNVEVGSPWGGGGGAIGIANGATLNDLTLDAMRFINPDTDAYDAVVVQGAAALTRLTITGSIFDGFQPGRFPLDLRGATLTEARIVGNRFININNTSGYTSVWINRAGSDNLISRNSFEHTPGRTTGFGVFFSDMGRTALQPSGWTVDSNSFDGRVQNSVYVGPGSGILTVQRNTFGPASFGGGTATNETNSIALVHNASLTANQGITTWFPTSVSYDTLQCTLDVVVAPPTVGSIPLVPVDLDLYYTAATQAEVYLGRAEAVSTPTTVTVPYTLGPGNIRIQTIAATGASSQYSRIVAQTEPDGCGPRVTVDQAASQADPTSERDIRFSVQFSEPIAGALEAGAIDVSNSTAPGARVVDVVAITSTTFEVVVRADASGSVEAGLAAGAVVDLDGNPSVASTSTDNVVTYVSPLSLAPTSLTVTEGEAGEDYVVTKSLAATAPITIDQVIADPSWVSVTPTPLVIGTTAVSGSVTIEAVDDLLVNGDRPTSIEHAVSSPDPNFDGLLLDPVAVTVLDDDEPSATESLLETTAGSRIADGTDEHSAIVTVRNAAGEDLAGVLVTFQVSDDADLGATSCVTDGAGMCSVPVTSVVSGFFSVQAFIGGAIEIVGPPATVEFVAGPVSLTTSTIVSSVLSLPADGESGAVVTVTLRDALGNLVSTGGAVDILTDAGQIVGVTDNGDGTWTGTLVAPTTTGIATIGFTYEGQPGEQTVAVNFTAGEPSASTTTIAVDPDSLVADGVSSSTVTVTAVDGYGNLVGVGGADISIAIDTGSVSTATDNGDGTYTATFVAPTTAGVATLRPVIDSTVGTNSAQIQLVPGEASVSESTISASPSAVTADGVSQSAITVTLIDANGNPLGVGGADVEITSDLGSLSTPVDYGDGTYTATLTAPPSPGIANLGFVVDGATGENTTQVQFLAGAPDAVTSGIVADPTAIVADGVSTATVTVSVRDAQGTLLVEGGADVDIFTDAGAVTTTTDNGDGTYAAILTASTTASVATLGFRVGGVLSPNTTTVEFVAGEADPGNAVIVATPTTVTADGVSASTVEVTLFDSFGNAVVPSPGQAEFSITVGTITAPTISAGAVVAYATSTVSGTAEVSFTVDGVPASATAEIEFVAGSASPDDSTITAVPDTVVADGVAAAEVTVSVRDEFDNPVTTGVVVTVETTSGSLSVPVDQGDGTWTAQVTSAVAGEAVVSFRVDGVLSTQTASVEFVAGAPDLGSSTIEADPVSIEADGVSSSAVTVRLVDGQGNPLAVGGAVVEILSDIGSVSATVDNGEGTYGATLTSDTTAGTATVSFTIDGAAAAATVEVDFTPGAADLTQSLIDAAPTELVADGVSSSQITVTLVDANGNPLGVGGDDVEIVTDAGMVSGTVDNGDGTYTATLQAPTAVGVATVGFTIGGVAAVATVEVAFVAGDASADTSTIEADPTSITADGVSTSTVTVTLRDAEGNPLASGGVAVTMDTTAGSLSAPVDNADGTYTSTLTSSTAAGQATVTFAIGGAVGTDDAVVTFVAGVADPATSSIAAVPGVIVADGVSTAQITVTLRDAQSNPVTDAGDIVEILSDIGTVGAVTDNADGTYTAALTSTTQAATAVVSFTVDGVDGVATTVVQFVAGQADASTSQIDAQPAVLTADGGSESIVTVTLYDAFDNVLNVSGGAVVIETTAGTVSVTSDNGDGTYDAVLTSDTMTGTAILTFTLEGVAGTQTASVEFVAGAPDPGTSTIEADPGFLEADGVSTSTITVRLLDASGNPVGGGGYDVEMATTAGSITTAVDNGDGTYTSILTAPTSTEPPSASVTFIVDGAPATRSVVVAFVAGVQDAGSSTISVSEDSIVADGVSTSTVTVVVRDAFGNPVPGLGDVVGISSSAGTVGSVTDEGDGTYRAVLTSSTTAGTATVSFTVEDVPGTDTATVAFVAGSPDANSSTISVSEDSIVADGVSTSTVTVVVRDAFGNPVPGLGEVVGISSSAGTIGSVSDEGDGTYRAVLTSSTTAGTATVSFTVDGVAGTDTATVAFVAGPPDAGSSTISASPPQFEAGAGSSTITVHLADRYGNPTVESVGVSMMTTLGSLSTPVDNGDGTHTATLTSDEPGTAIVSFAISGVSGADVAEVEVLDTTPPDPVVIDTPVDGSTVGSRPSIGGDGEPGATVTVAANGTDTCTTVVGTDGRWQCFPATPFESGSVTLVAVQTDAGGNTSPDSDSVTVTVVASPPPAPVLDPTNGSRVSGTSLPGLTVTVRDSGGTVICVSTVGADSRFECVPDEPLALGALVSATAADEFGNVSDATLVRVGGARVSLAFGSRIAGETQGVVGLGFLPGESIVATLESTPIDLGRFTASVGGDIAFEFTVPLGIEPGTHSVILVGEDSGAVRATFEVRPPAAGGGGALPTTGGTAVQPLLPLGVVLLLVGLLLVAGRGPTGSRQIFG